MVPQSSLRGRIVREIRETGPIPFARFMELALYDESEGYYSAGGRRLGTAGDFFTASDVGRAFGRAMAVQVGEIDRVAGPLDPFHVLEFGAGRGLLARDLLEAVGLAEGDLSGRLRYSMIDRSAAMREQARRSVPGACALAPEAVEGGHQGCVLAIELFDALPVHRLRRQQGKLVEIFVDLDAGGELIERVASPTAQARALAERYGAAADEGSEAEVAPAAGPLLDRMEGCLTRGVLIIVDYGGPADWLYSPARRRGTLLAYRGNETHENYLEQIGEQDLTAHVNFSQLEDRARERGLEVLGRTTQDRFLIGNGILAAFEGDQAGWSDPRRVKQRLQAMQLIHPSGMGRTFRVLVLSKGFDPAPRLAGLADPFADGSGAA